MLQKIESIRKKPKEVRQRYAFWGAFGFTGIIVVFWLVSLPSQLNFVLDVPSEETQRVQGGFARSFAGLRASISSVMDKGEKGEVVPEAVVPVSTAASGTAQTLDFESFFSTTSPVVQAKSEQSAPVNHVLIGTTSAKKSDSQEN